MSYNVQTREPKNKLCLGLFSVPSSGPRSRDSNTKMPWWHPGWTKLLSLQTVKTLKLNWLLRSCTTGCQTRRPTCSMNRTVWHTTRPITACTTKAPSRARPPTALSPPVPVAPGQAALPSLRLTMNPISVSLCAMLHPATSWDQRLCPLPGSSRVRAGMETRAGTLTARVWLSRFWRWTSAQIESCLFFSAVPFIIIHPPPSLICKKLEIVGIYFFSRNHVF